MALGLRLGLREDLPWLWLDQVTGGVRALRIWPEMSQKGLFRQVLTGHVRMQAKQRTARNGTEVSKLSGHELGLTCQAPSKLSRALAGLSFLRIRFGL